MLPPKTGTIVKLAILILLAGALALGAWWLWQKFHPLPEQERPPENTPVITPTLTAPIPRSDPSLPAPASDIASRTEITLRDTVKPGDSVGTVHTHRIWVNTPTDPKKPPRIQSDSPITATFSTVEDSWLQLAPRIVLGASVTTKGHPNPWGGLKVVHLWKRGGLGIGADLDAAGIWGGVEFFREFTLAAEWNPLQYGPHATKWSFQIAYRF